MLSEQKLELSPDSPSYSIVPFRHRRESPPAFLDSTKPVGLRGLRFCELQLLDAVSYRADNVFDVPAECGPDGESCGGHQRYNERVFRHALPGPRAVDTYPESIHTIHVIPPMRAYRVPYAAG